MSDQQAVWDDNAGNDPPAEPSPSYRTSRTFGAVHDDSNKSDATPHKDTNELPSLQKNGQEISRDEINQRSEEWDNTKKQAKINNGNECKSENIEKIKEEGSSKTQNLSYDNFVKDLKDAPVKKQNQNLNASNWDTSINAEDNAFKKKKIQEQSEQATQNVSRARGDGPFKRAQNEDQGQNGNYGFSGGRGRNFQNTEREATGWTNNGGRGFSSDDRGGGFADRGGRGFGGDRGGNFGQSGGRGGFGDRGGRGFGGFGERGGRGFGGFGDRGGGFGRGRGGGFGRRDFGDRDNGGGGGFGRRDFGDRDNGGGGGFGRRDFGDHGNGGRRDFNNAQPQRPTITPQVQSQTKSVFNIADLSVIEGLQNVVQKNKISPQFRINTTMATQPLGLKCWPTVSIYVKKAKVSLYLSRIHDHNCSIMYFPYSNYSMNLYPGNMVNQFPFDYRKKLKQKNKPVGQAYLQRAVGIKNFQVIAFALVSETEQQSTAKSLQSLFDQASRAQNQILQSLLIPYSQALGSLKPIIKSSFDALDKYEKFKEIIISTNDPKTFCKAASQFLEVIQELADNNDLVIQ